MFGVLECAIPSLTDAHTLNFIDTHFAGSSLQILACTFKGLNVRLFYLLLPVSASTGICFYQYLLQPVSASTGICFYRYMLTGT